MTFYSKARHLRSCVNSLGLKVPAMAILTRMIAAEAAGELGQRKVE